MRGCSCAARARENISSPPIPPSRSPPPFAFVLSTDRAPISCGSRRARVCRYTSCRGGRECQSPSSLKRGAAATDQAAHRNDEAARCQGAHCPVCKVCVCVPRVGVGVCASVRAGWSSLVRLASPPAAAGRRSDWPHATHAHARPLWARTVQRADGAPDADTPHHSERSERTNEREETNDRRTCMENTTNNQTPRVLSCVV